MTPNHMHLPVARPAHPSAVDVAGVRLRELVSALAVRLPSVCLDPAAREARPNRGAHLRPRRVGPPASEYPPLRVPVRHVVGGASSEQMIGSNARRVVAAVAGLFIGQKGSPETHLERDAVSRSRCVRRELEAPVASSTRGPRPEPARPEVRVDGRSVVVDSLPEALVSGQGSLRRSHRSQLYLFVNNDTMPLGLYRNGSA